MQRWRAFIIGVGVVSALTLGIASPASAAASVQVFRSTTEFSNFPALLPTLGCVNGGSGEVILLTGTVKTVSVVTTDAAGGLHVTVKQNFLNTTGVGTLSGDTYRVTDSLGLQGDPL